MTRVEWAYTVETSRLLRVLAATALGAVGSVFVLAAGFVVFLVATSLLAGEVAILALFVFGGLLFARRLAVHAALVGSGDVGFAEFLSPRDLLVASVAWAVAIAGLLALDVPLLVVQAGAALAVFGFLPVVAALRSEGYVDTDAGALHVNDSDTPLAAVKSARTYRFGPVTVLRVHYHGGTGASVPRLLGVPAEKAERVRAALETDVGDPPESDRNPLVTRTLYGFGLCSLALAAAFAYLGLQRGGDAAVVGTYAAVFGALFGAIFLWLGYVEG